ncbi:Iron-containing alcohol dehydrogenase [Fragilaria crotonensis]|nr:Iron-containing alcohol dehydrogenase [Fragilaria crotonensis]
MSVRSSINSQIRLLGCSRRFSTDDALDRICELAASNLRFGPGSTAEVGKDLAESFKASRVVVFTDANIEKLPPMHVLSESLERSGIGFSVYNQVRIEPNDVSFRHAIEFLRLHGAYDAIVALGGGSVIDTAKAANLYASVRPSDFYDYVNPPIGKGLPIPTATRLPPLIAIPTTAGTGSETTGVAIFDDTPTKSKTGIANRSLKPTLGIVDPDNTKTLPERVAVYSGLDVLCHALESYTALPFNQRPRPDSPLLRPAYQGSNPISDVWSIFALETCATHLPRVILDNNDDSRAQMLIASSAAGLGFGNAGVHLCHGMSYPISSQVKSTYVSDYVGADHAMIPHGLSVIVGAPAVFAFTGIANAERHAKCARILATARGVDGGSLNCTKGDYAGCWLAEEIRELLQVVNVPLGLHQFGYTEADIPSLVEGTLPQHRVTKISPRKVGRKEIEDLFVAAMSA